MTSLFLRTAVQHPPSQLRKLTQQRPCIPRVDDILDPEFLRRPERRAHTVQSRANRLQMRRGVLRRLQLRSDEHTSELQSLMRISYAVFCLKKTQIPKITTQDPKNPRHY